MQWGNATTCTFTIDIQQLKWPDERICATLCPSSISWEKLEVSLSRVRGRLWTHIYTWGLRQSPPSPRATLCYIQIGVVETPGHWVMCVGGWGFRRPFTFGCERGRSSAEPVSSFWSSTTRRDKLWNHSALCKNKAWSKESAVFTSHGLPVWRPQKRGTERQPNRGGGASGFPQAPWLLDSPEFKFNSAKSERKPHLTVADRYFI